MKKVLAILLVLIVAMTGVMAAEVNLKSSVAKVSYFGVSSASQLSGVKAYIDSGATTGGYAGSGNPWGSKVILNRAFDSEKTVYFGYLTNDTYSSSSAPEVKVLADPFLLDSVSENWSSEQQVGYKVTVDVLGDGASATSQSVSSGASKVLIGLPVSFSKFDVNDTGLRANEAVLTFTADSADVRKAEAGNYTAIITFSVTSL